MTISKDFRFPVSASWQDDQVTRVTASVLETIDVAVPPEFNGPGGHWSPEPLLGASAGSCFPVPLVAVAKRRGIPIISLTVSGTGHVGHRDDGRTGFVAIELTPRNKTEPNSSPLR